MIPFYQYSAYLEKPDHPALSEEILSTLGSPDTVLNFYHFVGSLLGEDDDGVLGVFYAGFRHRPLETLNTIVSSLRELYPSLMFIYTDECGFKPFQNSEIIVSLCHHLKTYNEYLNWYIDPLGVFDFDDHTDDELNLRDEMETCFLNAAIIRWSVIQVLIVKGILPNDESWLNKNGFLAKYRQDLEAAINMLERELLDRGFNPDTVNYSELLSFAEFDHLEELDFEEADEDPRAAMSSAFASMLFGNPELKNISEKQQQLIESNQALASQMKELNRKLDVLFQADSKGQTH